MDGCKMVEVVKCPKCGHKLEKMGVEPYETETGFKTTKTVYACDHCREYYDMDNDSGQWIEIFTPNPALY